MSQPPGAPSSSAWRRRLVSLTSRSKTPDPAAVAATAAVAQPQRSKTPAPPSRAKTPAPTSGSSSHRRAASNAEDGYMTDAASRRRPGDSRSRGPPTIAPPVPALPPTIHAPAGSRQSFQQFPIHPNSQALRPPSRNASRAAAPLPPFPIMHGNDAEERPKKIDFLSDSEQEGPPEPTAGFKNRVRRLPRPLDSKRLDEMNLLQGVALAYPLNVGEEARRLEKYLYGLVYHRLRSNQVDRIYRNGGPSFHKWEYPPRKVLDVGCGYGYWIRDAKEFWPYAKFIAFDFHRLIPDHWGEQVQFVQGNLLGDQHGKLPRSLIAQGPFDLIRMANMSLAVPWNQWSIVLGNLQALLSERGIFEFVDDGWFPPLFEEQCPRDKVFLRSYDEYFEIMLERRGIRSRNVAQRDWAQNIISIMEKFNMQHTYFNHVELTTLAPSDSLLATRWYRALNLCADAIESTFTSYADAVNEEISVNIRNGKAENRQLIRIPSWVEEFHNLRNIIDITTSEAYVYNDSIWAFLAYRRRTREEIAAKQASGPAPPQRPQTSLARR
ncbi:hypothetical protein DACRYDRAFT_117660 [Dacryopinax primogenitus]|uniref:Methyltransferase domain-containing protein n=1 Tax=Dacryopinax primogenitus (strain DJM 731) TaxID=1858805 RepID=M5FWK7_DACPD|nr:uncharacterized protein DACRYDRAFT_117660 [Dacryopinax primogenitus]EJU00070.1 hypothetical protein DACRYDRAFT_117660 [Dacryopinax primogenitus]